MRLERLWWNEGERVSRPRELLRAGTWLRVDQKQVVRVRVRVPSPPLRRPPPVRKPRRHAPTPPSHQHNALKPREEEGDTRAGEGSNDGVVRSRDRDQALQHDAPHALGYFEGVTMILYSVLAEENLVRREYLVQVNLGVCRVRVATDSVAGRYGGSGGVG